MTFDKGLGVEADVSVTAAAIAFVYVCNEWRRVNALCHRRAIKAKMNFIGNNCEAPPPNFIGTSFVCGIDGQAEASWKRASSFRRLPLPLSLPPLTPSIRLRVLNSPAIEASTTLRAIKSQSNHQQSGNATETITNGNGNAYAHTLTTQTHTHTHTRDD